MSDCARPQMDFGAIRAFWKQFATGVQTENDAGTIRPEIFESWRRCQKLGIDPFRKTNPHVLSREELERRRQANAELIAVAGPIMDKLYEFVRGSGFVVVLGDVDGVLLRLKGDPEAEEFGRLSNLVEGSNWSEVLMGTNGVGTPLATQKPIQVYGPEHYCLCAHNATCSGAPIFDSLGHVVGVLDMTGRNEEVHLHTLGMVVAAADAITNEMQLRQVNRQKEAIMQSMSEGILVIDRNGCITHINAAAARTLQLDPGRVIGRRLEDLVVKTSPTPTSNMRLLEMIRSSTPVTDELVDIESRVGTIRLSLTFRPLKGEGGLRAGTVMVVSERKRVRQLIKNLAGTTARFDFTDIVGQNPKFLEAVRLARQAAQVDSTVLLTGESGTGKDVFAQAIHNASSRSERPFVVINCGAIPRELLASELFGYVEGAFTGARKGGNIGKFELADGGTIFLDEIGELPLDMQVALLRIIEDKALMRVGGKEAVPLDVRVIAATNRNLSEEVANGRFRADLYYRLNVLRIHLPPLRERKEDIPLLVNHMIGRLAERMGYAPAGIEAAAVRALCRYDWPGNVRELQNVIEQALVAANGGTVSLASLPEAVRCLAAPGDLALRERNHSAVSLETLELNAIREAIERCGGNIARAARELGVHRNTIYRKLGRAQGGGFGRLER